MEKKPKNDIAWESLFEKLSILEQIDKNGIFEISATTIKTEGEREARLMAKFDSSIQLPKIFKKNSIAIQPNTRGSYLLGRFISYQKLPKNVQNDIRTVEFPSYIKTIDPAKLTSETASLLCAYHSKIICDLVGEETLLTVGGRMSTGKFDYFISDIKTDAKYLINVTDAQCEIDGGFEGEETFTIVEAKNISVDDFLIRQLYYPYRLWAGNTEKRVIPVFMSYSNDVFSFYKFRFNELTHYNSIELVEVKRYQIVPREIELDDIVKVLEKIKILPEPEGVPFPQADSFDRVVDLLNQLREAGAPVSQDFVTTKQAFDLRQTQYYTNAIIYFGLAQRHYKPKEGVSYSLTKKGVSIMKKAPQARNLALVECVLQRQVFNETFRLYLDKGQRPSRADVVEIMKTANLKLDQQGKKQTTIPRRAGTVLSWIDWIMRLQKR